MITLDDFKRLLDSKGLHYKISNDGRSILFDLKTKTIPESVISLVSIERGEFTIYLRAFKLGTEITREIKDAINSCNRDCLYYAIYHKDGYLWMRCNSIVAYNNTCTKINNIFIGGYQIAEIFYPRFQKILRK